MLLEKADIAGAGEKTNCVYSGIIRPYLEIYYQSGATYPPGLHIDAGSDTISVTGLAVKSKMVAVIDSTGGANVTVRGFKMWKKGAASSDSLDKRESGTWTTGVTFNLTSDSLKADTLYYYKAFATNTSGTTQTDGLDTINTYVTDVVVATHPDTLKYMSGVLTGELTITSPFTAAYRGFKYWPKGASLAADTLTRTTLGTYNSGSYTKWVDSLLVDTVYYFKAFGTTAGGQIWGNTDSVQTSGTGAGTTTTASFYVDGRLVSGIH